VFNHARNPFQSSRPVATGCTERVYFGVVPHHTKSVSDEGVPDKLASACPSAKRGEKIGQAVNPERQKCHNGFGTRVVNANIEHMVIRGPNVATEYRECQQLTVVE
jgi:hypothetical protein